MGARRNEGDEERIHRADGPPVFLGFEQREPSIHEREQVSFEDAVGCSAAAPVVRHIQLHQSQFGVGRTPREGNGHANCFGSLQGTDRVELPQGVPRLHRRLHGNGGPSGLCIPASLYALCRCPCSLFARFRPVCLPFPSRLPGIGISERSLWSSALLS